MGTTPHEGYAIIKQWAEHRFRNSAFGEGVRRRLTSHGFSKDVNPGVSPYQVPSRPGAFFAFTSNVDAHLFDWFDAGEIRECHGNTEMYQCSSKSCESGIWRAPLDYHFEVDEQTMLAKNGAASKI